MSDAQNPATREALMALLDPSGDDRHIGRNWAGMVLHPKQAVAIADAIFTVLHPAPVAVPPSAFGITAGHLERQKAFSQETFGPGSRLAGVLDHIRKELVEVEVEPGDMSEWADVVILAFDGALRQGHDPQALLDAILAKQVRNERRVWPDWRTADPDKAIEHVHAPKDTE